MLIAQEELKNSIKNLKNSKGGKAKGRFVSSLCFFVWKMKVNEIYEKFNIERTSDTDFALAEVLGKNRSELMFCEVSEKQLKKFLKINKKLEKGYPLDLILGFSNFYGRKFLVNKHVLKPRLDTEFVCEKSLEFVDEKSKVLDLCCGSGVIGITVAKEKEAYVVFADVSRKALKVCKKNVKAHNACGKVIKSDLFAKINEKFDVIISNPPYIKTKDIESLEKNVKKFDPRLALDGGEDGLDFYRKIISQAPGFLTDEGKLIMEIGFDEGVEVLKLMQKDFFVTLLKDYNNNDRLVIGELKDGKTRKND